MRAHIICTLVEVRAGMFVVMKSPQGAFCEQTRGCDQKNTNKTDEPLARLGKEKRPELLTSQMKEGINSQSTDITNIVKECQGQLLGTQILLTKGN